MRFLNLLTSALRQTASARASARAGMLHAARRAAIACALLAAVTTIASPGAFAQIRSFPQNTKVGMLQIGNFPEAVLDNKRVVLAPGVRIYNENNMSVVPMSIEGPKRIRYRLDPMGQVDLAWILSADEARAALEK